VLDAIRDLELSVCPQALPPRGPGRIRELRRLPAATSTRTARSYGLAPEPSSLVLARDVRFRRTIAHALGLSDLSGRATKRFIDPPTAQQMLTVGSDLLRPVPHPPNPTQTALELPFRLILSPNRYGAWFHSETAVTSTATGHTELWHT